MPREAVTNEELTDEEIARQVMEAIAWDSRVHYPEVRVTVEGGVVYLSGTVESFAEKSAAEEDASRLAGVTEVISNIVVRPQKPVSDEEIADNIRRALKRDVRVRTDDICVKVENGVATLAGEVVTPMEKWAALDIAKYTYGVVSVVDKIAVLPSESVSDHLLEELIKAELTRVPRLDPRGINVTVKEGIATLSGTVDFFYQKKEAELAALGTPGIRSVKEDLSVRWKRS
ncbi:MAG: BON domain-containing protein [Armatimonadota bacterium]|nr:BON domain-containing protein [Armatimonadota bacterium]